jgi:predicted nuclease of predicted toxin-antitoxin system
VISLLADQNFNEHIVDGLMRRLPTLEIVVAWDVDLAEAQDPVVLQWAALNGRVLLTHDRRTVPSYARSRVEAGLPMQAYSWLATTCLSVVPLRSS